jgi:hypothetical protein
MHTRHSLPLQHFLLQAKMANMWFNRSRGGKEYAYPASVVSCTYLFKLLSVQPYPLYSAVCLLSMILCIPCFIVPQSRPSMHTVQPHYIRPFDKECCHCHALHWLAEKRSVTPMQRPQFADCCRSGEVQIPMLDPLSADLHRLYEANDTKSIEFRRYI